MSLVSVRFGAMCGPSLVCMRAVSCTGDFPVVLTSMIQQCGGTAEVGLLQCLHRLYYPTVALSGESEEGQ